MPPPFPVIAPPKTGATLPPIPHVKVAGEVEEVVPAPHPKAAPNRLVKFGIIGVAAVVVLGGAFFAWNKFGAKPPPPVATKPKPAVPAPAKGPVAAPPAKAAPLTPSETLNNLAHAPVNAINKAQDTIAARRASEQSRVDGTITGDDPRSGIVAVPPSSATVAKPGAPASKTATAVTALSPGLSATTEVEAGPEASPAFRSFVANAKISGVFQGEPPRAFINGRLARAGETIDATLGVIFERIDPDKKQIVFKDRTGATIARRY